MTHIRFQCEPVTSPVQLHTHSTLLYGSIDGCPLSQRLRFCLWRLLSHYATHWTFCSHLKGCTSLCLKPEDSREIAAEVASDYWWGWGISPVWYHRAWLVFCGGRHWDCDRPLRWAAPNEIWDQEHPIGSEASLTTWKWPISESKRFTSIHPNCVVHTEWNLITVYFCQQWVAMVYNTKRLSVTTRIYECVVFYHVSDFLCVGRCVIYCVGGGLTCWSGVWLPLLLL